jgi:LPXTG-site transpeptidase (sortase) family protein
MGILVDMVRQLLNRSIIYRKLSTLLLSAGIILTCFLVARFAREEIEMRVAKQADYIVIAGTPMFELPPATPLPTVTPLPTITPIPLPAIRLSIPAIGLNSSIRETYPVTIIAWTGEEQLIWQPVSFAVGHLDTSGYPGEGTNITLFGHNNTEGAVFQRLPELQSGDEVILFTEEQEFHYQVQDRNIIPYLGMEAEADAKLRSYAAPKSAEMVTMISCWPYTGNTNRIVVVAVPAGEN